MNLLWFTHETAAFYVEQCTTPSSFHNFEVLPGACNHSLKSYGFQFGTPFSSFAHTHTHVLTHRLATTQNYYPRSLN